MAPPPNQFILFGDSLSQLSNDQSRGFSLASELQNGKLPSIHPSATSSNVSKAYVRRLDVINRGHSGYNTNHGLEVLEKVFPTPEQASIKFLTVWFGANDANKNLSPINQYVPIDQFKQNLLNIINHPVVKAHSPNIILITPPPVEESILESLKKEWGYTGEVRQTTDAAAYADAVWEVGKEAGVAVLDAWTIFMKETGWTKGNKVLPGSKELGQNEVLTELLYDGLHLSGKGYKLVFDGLVDLIREKWPEYPPYKMPFKEKVAWELSWEQDKGEQFWDVNNIR